MRRKRLPRWMFKAAFVLLLMFGSVWLMLPLSSAGAATQVGAREKSALVFAPSAQATIVPLPTRPPTPVGAQTSAPAEVPEADTLLLMSGGIAV